MRASSFQFFDVFVLFGFLSFLPTAEHVFIAFRFSINEPCYVIHVVHVNHGSDVHRNFVMYM